MRSSDQVLAEAKRLYNLGFAILWIKPKSKRPVESKWTTGERTPWVKLCSTYKKGYNVGVRTGRASVVNAKYLACIDVDIKDPASYDTAMKALMNLIGDQQLPEVRSGSGGGSRHLYCVTSETFKMVTVAKRKDQFEICIYSDGRQMVLPPSIHPSGKPYVWEQPIEGDVPEFPMSRILSVSGGGDDGEGTEGTEDSGGFDDDGFGDQSSPREAREERSDDSLKGNFKVRDVDLEWLPISEKLLKGIKDGTDVADRSGFLLLAASGLHSAGLDRDEILSVLSDPRHWLSSCAYDHVQSKNRQRAVEWLWKYTVRKIFTERTASSVFTQVNGEGDGQARLTADEMEKQTADLLSEINWRQYLDRSKAGKLIPTLKNLDLIFSHAVEGDVFIKDLFANRVIYGDNTPWGGKRDAALEDIDLILVKRWLADAFGIEPSTNAILEATSLVGHKKRIHPVRDWLENLKWDGTSRVNTWIKDYCQGEAEEPYLSQVSRKFLLAMVKRIFQPGCQWDYTVVLEGKQGQYKSTIARTLASDKWFMDNLPDLKDKDAMLSLQGKWLIELGELASVKRTDFNLVKAYLSRRIDTVRVHYGRIASDVPRQSVFIGTVNEGQYLKDPTGNRRYWPVKVGLCDVKGLTAVRDQLFAEAVHIHRETGEILMLDDAATKQASEAQDDRRVEDDESEMRDSLKDFMESIAADSFNFERFRARELFEGANAPWGRFNDKTYAMQTAAVVLNGMGFERHKVEGQRVWRKPGHMPVSSMPRGLPRSAPVAENDFF